MKHRRSRRSKTAVEQVDGEGWITPVEEAKEGRKVDQTHVGVMLHLERLVELNRLFTDECGVSTARRQAG